MFFFNLSAVEFLALLGGVSSVVVALYLLDRSRRKQVVATLRFWRNSDLPAERKNRRRIQQPWSLILQLIAIALLLAALAQLRLGSPDRASRDHVLLVDASAWMAARQQNGRPLIADSRTAALRYVRALPSSDRVMIVRADALATPLTGFESSRQKIDAALRQIEPGAAALNLGLALDFAGQAMRLESKRTGEIVYAGAARMAREEIAEMPAPPANLRLLPIDAQPENCGIRKLAIRRRPADPEIWEVFVTARNYGSRPRNLPLVVAFGGAPVATRRLALAPGAEVSVGFDFRTKAAGWLDAKLQANDALPADDAATIELPAEQTLRVAVYSAEPELLRPVLAANRRVETVFRKPAEYNTNDGAAIVILDRFPPAIPPEKMSEAQRKAVADLVATRGALKGPFMAIMRCPDLMDRIQRVGEYIRYKGALDLRINRMAGLMMTRYWSNQYEWHGNTPYALKPGLNPAIIEAIGEGRRPASMADDETIVHEFMTELLTNKSVSDPTYERAVAKFGEDGIIELLGIVGYYGMLAMIMNVVRTPVPDGDPLSLGPMPEQIKPVL